MASSPQNTAVESPGPRRLFFASTPVPQVQRILSLAGYDLQIGQPTSQDFVAISRRSANRQESLTRATESGASALFVEDAFLSTVIPSTPSAFAPFGLLLDNAGAHFDPSHPSDLETLLKHAPLDDTALLNRARGAIARLKETHLTKISAVETDIAPPDPGYVLVVDQPRDDISVSASNANELRFQEMLVLAQEENPGARVLIKTHPYAQPGYYTEKDATDRVSLITDPISPWLLLEGAIAVYTVSSQLGFEAILAGHKPRVFGQPYYAGWNLTQDEFPIYRRQRRLTRAQLFAAAMILYPTWYDPCRDELCELETVIEQLAAETTAWRADRKGWNAFHMRSWKRKPLKKFFGRYKAVSYLRRKPNRPNMIWGSASTAIEAIRVEDGFIRSRGLGAELIPPLSLVCDDLGIYYDPRSESRLEHLISERTSLREDQRLRAERLVRSMRKLGISKYNLGSTDLDLPEGHRILVPGQVEDDASILTGTDRISANLDLLKATREANPTARILYKPHPDVEAGLRAGAIPRDQALEFADAVLHNADMAELLENVQEVWTMTSLTGFEALLRGCKVTTFGAPFYAGWGLTSDLGTVPERRTAKPDLAGLVHATLIDYPRYYDPVSDRPCPVEIVVERLSTGNIPHPGKGNRLLAKLQGRFARLQSLWR